MGVNTQPLRALEHRRVLDVVGATMLLLLAMPLLLIGMLAVWIDTGRPIFFGHVRLGLGGQPFRCLKLRTMVLDAEDRLEREPLLRQLHISNGYKLPTYSDPRVTRAGRWLRRTYVDELPQLFNVLEGSMSLVGPRPIVAAELAHYGSDADVLLAARPGVFGAWTSLGRERPDYPARARLELEYVRNPSLGQDLEILLRAVPVILRGQEGPASPAATLSRPAAPGSATQTVLRNGIFLLVAYVVPRMLTFGAVIVAARVLESAAFGAYSTAAAFAVMLSIVATLGMTPLLVLEMARNPERAPALLRSAHRLKSVTNAVMLATLSVLGWYVLDYPAPVMAAALVLGIGYAIGAYVENLAAYFQAVERMEVWMQASVLTGLVWGVAGTVLIVGSSNLIWFCLAPALGQLAGLGWLYSRLPAEIRRGAQLEPGHLSSLARPLVPFAAAAIALTIYYKIDVLLLAFWRSDAEVGIYSAAYKLVDIWQALIIVAVSAAYPRLARSARRTDDGRRWAATRVTELVLLIAVPVAAIVWLTRAPTILALYGSGYRDAVAVLSVLAFILPALAINVLSGYVLASSGHMAHAAALYAAGAVLNISLNTILVPGMGAPGAAQAMLVSEVLLACAFLARLRIDSAAPNARTAAIGAGALALWAVAANLPASLPAWVAASLYIGAVTILYHRTRAFGTGEWQDAWLTLQRALAGTARGGERRA